MRAYFDSVLFCVAWPSNFCENNRHLQNLPKNKGHRKKIFKNKKFMTKKKAFEK